MSVTKRARMLALHGYHGSAAMVRRQMAPLMVGLDDAIDVPSIAAGSFGWWHAVDQPSDDGAHIEDPGVGPRHKL